WWLALPEPRLHVLKELGETDRAVRDHPPIALAARGGQGQRVVQVARLDPRHEESHGILGAAAEIPALASSILDIEHVEVGPERSQLLRHTLPYLLGHLAEGDKEHVPLLALCGSQPAPRVAE